MKRLSIALVLVVSLIFACSLIGSPDRQIARASGSTLNASATCSSDGTDSVAFAWQGNDPTAFQQWLDASTQNNGWQTGTFVSAGPFSASTSSYTWAGFQAGGTFYVRLNQQLASGSWDPTFTYTLTTGACSSSVPVSSSSGSSNSSSTSSSTQSTSGGYASGSSSTYQPYTYPTPVPTGPFIPYAGNGGGPTQCADGTVSHSSGSGTCSHHGGEAH